MARWEPKTPKEMLQSSLDRLKKRIKAKKDEVKELEGQAQKVEQALAAMG